MSAACGKATGLSTQIAPRSSRSTALSWVRFQTTVGNPASRMFAAMGCPIRPRPAMPTVGCVCIRLSIASAALSLSGPPAIAKLIEDDRKDQDHANGHGLEVGLHANEVHAIGEDGDEERAKDRPHDPSFAAPQRDATYHRGRDRFERVLTAEIRFTGRSAGGKQQSGNSREQTAHNIDRSGVHT